MDKYLLTKLAAIVQRILSLLAENAKNVRITQNQMVTNVYASSDFINFKIIASNNAPSTPILTVRSAYVFQVWFHFYKIVYLVLLAVFF